MSSVFIHLRPDRSSYPAFFVLDSLLPVNARLRLGAACFAEAEAKPTAGIQCVRSHLRRPEDLPAHSVVSASLSFIWPPPVNAA